MIVRGLFQNKRVALMTGLFASVTTVFILVNAFVVGGDAFFNYLNAILPCVAALLTSFYAYQAWVEKKDPIANTFWYRMMWAFGLWGLAEAIWATYSLVLQVEVPYPSLADLVWVVGYIPLYGALLSRLRTLKLSFSRRQLVSIIGLNFIWLLLVGFFVLTPMLQDWDASRILESITTIIYPIGDLVMVVLARVPQ